MPSAGVTVLPCCSSHSNGGLRACKTHSICMHGGHTVLAETLAQNLLGVTAVSVPCCCSSVQRCRRYREWVVDPHAAASLGQQLCEGVSAASGVGQHSCRRPFMF
jgi:hypothetical protein